MTVAVVETVFFNQMNLQAKRRSSPRELKQNSEPAIQEHSLPPSSYRYNLVSLPKHVINSLKDKISSLPHLSHQRPILPKPQPPQKLQPPPPDWGTLPLTQPDSKQSSRSSQPDSNTLLGTFKPAMEDSNYLVEQFFAQQRARFSSLSPPIVIEDDEEMSPPSFGSTEGVYHSSDVVFTDSNEQCSQPKSSLPPMETQYSQSIHTLIASPVVKQVRTFSILLSSERFVT